MIKKLLTTIAVILLLNTAAFADDIKIDLDGYFMTCTDTSVLYVQKDGVWQKGTTELPPAGMYYLDDTYYGYGMCDYVTCQKIQNPFILKFINYEKIGEKASPNPQNDMGDRPVFKTVPLEGPVKVVINYFSDDQCTHKESFEKTYETAN